VNVGDSVTWMLIRTHSGGTSFSERVGVIERLQNSMAFVRMRNGRRLWMSVADLRKEGEKTEVSELFDRICKEISSAPAEVIKQPSNAGALGNTPAKGERS